MGLRNHLGRLDLGVSMLIDQVLGGKEQNFGKKNKSETESRIKSIKSNQRG